MKPVSCLLLCAALLSAKTSMAAPLPILNIIEMKSTSLAKISATNQSGVTKEVTSLITMTEANLPKKIIQEQPNSATFFANTVDLYLNDPQNDYSGSVYAGVLFWSGGFTNSEHWSGFGGTETNYTSITGEATSQLDMRFTITGDGSMIGVTTYKNTLTGLFAFTLFDETDDRTLFDTATNGNGLYSNDLYLSSGHTYQLYAFSKIGPTPGQSIVGYFDWRNSPLILTVPECSTLMLSCLGCLLFFSYQRIYNLPRYLHFPKKQEEHKRPILR